jgi:putative FmdB family regulatory protein
MPTYDFRCPNGHEFTHFYKSMSAAQTQLPCPTCKATADRQMSAGAGLLFKGSGFYLTDYGKNAHRGGEKTSSSPSSKSDSGGSGDSGGGGGDKKSEAAPAKTESAKSEGPKPKAEAPKTKAEPKAK